MNIIPISGASSITPFQSAFSAPALKGSSPFRDMFTGAVGNLEELNAIKDQDAIALSLGNIDDIGAMQVNSQKAEVALQLLVQMRNKVLESYQEIMRISI
jgi:flagellar hook-basal body complex protein FliE